MSINQQPYIEVSTGSDSGPAPVENPRTLIIAGTTEDEQHGKLHENPSIRDVDSLFGASSIANFAYRKYKKYHETGEAHVLLLKNPQNTTGSRGKITITGAAGQSGILTAEIFDDQFRFDVSVSKGDTGAAILAKIKTEVDKVAVPFSATVTGNSLDVVLNFGQNNGLTSRVETNVSGLVITTTESADAAVGFYSKSDIDALLQTLKIRYHIIIFDSMTSDDAVIEYTESNFEVKNVVKSGVAMTMFLGELNADIANVTLDNAKTFVAFINVKSNAGVYVHKINAIPLLFLSEVAAKITKMLTKGANIRDLVLDVQDAIGGIRMCTSPLHRLPMSYKSTFDRSEITLDDARRLKEAGISIFNNALGTNRIELGTVYTSYKTGLDGQPDITFKYLNNVLAAMVVSEYYFNGFKSRFGKTRLTLGDPVPGLNMVNKQSVIAYARELYEELAAEGIAVKSGEAISAFTEGLEVNVNSENNGFTVLIKVFPVVSQVRSIILVINQTYQIG